MCAGHVDGRFYWSKSDFGQSNDYISIIEENVSSLCRQSDRQTGRLKCGRAVYWDCDANRGIKKIFNSASS